MEDNRNKILHTEDWDQYDKRGIKIEHFNQDEVSTKLEHHVLHNETYFVECNGSNDVDTKIGIKQESWELNAELTDIQSDPLILEFEQFKGSSTAKSEVEIGNKEEHLKQNEILTKAPKLDLQQNVAQFLKCNDSVDVDSKLEIKQKTWYPNGLLGEVNSHSQKPPFCLGIVTVKDDAEIQVKETSWWCDGASTDLHIKGKDSNWEKNESSKDILQLKSPRLPTEVVYYGGDCATSLGANKDGAALKIACEKSVSQELPIREYIFSFNSNSTCESDDFEQTKDISHTPLYQCEICEKCYMHKSSFKAHKLIHSTIKPYKCEYCEKCFTSKTNFKTHKLHHSETKPYRCAHCEKCFVHSSYLKRHLLLHSGTKPYKCKHCEKCFLHKSFLKRHTLIHSGAKPYKCEYCKKNFTLKSNLKSHIFLHLDTKTYKCEHCEKVFTHKRNLQRHTLLHLGTESYKCEICDKSYTHKSSLKTHTLLHSGIQPYECDKCHKCFTRKDVLQNHTLLHSGIKPYKCAHCEKFFTRKVHLQRHTLRHLDTKA